MKIVAADIFALVIKFAAFTFPEVKKFRAVILSLQYILVASACGNDISL